MGNINRIYEFTKNRLTKQNLLIFLVLIVTFIFIALYSQFIFNGYAYVYGVQGDIGVDTIHQYFATYSHISRMIHEGNIDIFSLQAALGESFLPKLISMFNLFDLIAVLFPPTLIDVGILVSTYLKYLVISIFSYLYFNMIFKNNKTSFICSLFWTFCSFIVIWGQHYSFSTAMANFTIFMYLIQKWLEGNKNIWKILIPCMGIFFLNSYYFFYMFGLFSAIYTFFYLIIQKKSLKEVFIKLLVLLGMAIVALLMVSVLVIPVILSFTNSPRSEINIESTYLLTKDLPQIFSILARGINPNILGSGYIDNPYTGYRNYYETSPIFVSIIAIPAIIYILKRKNSNCIKLGVIFSILTIVFCHLTNFIFTFSIANRWLFMISFLLTIAIGLYINDFIEKVNLKDRLISLFLGDIIVIIFIYILANYSQFVLDIQMVKMTLICLFIWNALLIGLCRFNIKYQLIVLCVISELLVVNYPSINNRGKIPRNQIYNSLYYDNYMAAVNYVKSIDPSLYRIDKTSDSVFLNDALVQNYYGNSSYFSTHTKEEWSLANNYGGCWNKANGPNYIDFDNVIFNAFVGNKYILSRYEISGLNLLNVVENIYIYMNPYFMGFGYIYENELDINTSNLSELDNILLLGEGYTKTDKLESKQSVKSNIKVENLINKYVYSANTNTQIKDDIVYSNGTSDDMQIVFDMESDRILSSISFDLAVSKDSVVEVFLFDENNKFTSYRRNIVAGNNQIDIDLYNLGNTSSIRIDPSEISQNISLSNIKIEYIDKSNFERNLNNIKLNGKVKADFEDSTYLANIESNVENGMLMVPITYSNNWKATIDGENVKVHNINNGFIGIEIPKGKHNVVVQYKYPYLFPGLIMSSIGVGIFLLILHKQKKKDIIEKKKYYDSLLF